MDLTERRVLNEALEHLFPGENHDQRAVKLARGSLYFQYRLLGERFSELWRAMKAEPPFRWFFR